MPAMITLYWARVRTDPEHAGGGSWHVRYPYDPMRGEVVWPYTQGNWSVWITPDVIAMRRATSKE